MPILLTLLRPTQHRPWSYMASIHNADCVIPKVSGLQAGVACVVSPLHLSSQPWLPLVSVAAAASLHAGCVVLRLPGLQAGVTVVRGSQQLGTLQEHWGLGCLEASQRLPLPGTCIPCISTIWTGIWARM